MKVIVLPPSGALRVPEQKVVAFAGEAMVTPAGRLSVKSKLLAPLEVRLVTVNSSVLTLPGPMVAGLKDLSNEIGSWAIAVDANATVASRRVTRSLRELMVAKFFTGKTS